MVTLILSPIHVNVVKFYRTYIIIVVIFITRGILISAEEMNYNIAPSSRLLYISNELNRQGIDTFVAGAFSENSISNANVIKVKQKWNNVGGRIIFLLHLQLIFLCAFLKKDNKFAIVRGCDMVLLMLFLKIAKKTVFYDFHGYVYKEELSKGHNFLSLLLKLADNLCIYLADYILVVSEGTRKDLSEKYIHKSLLLPNGIDLNIVSYVDEKSIDRLVTKYEIDANKKIIGFIGNWEHRVKVEDIINAKKYLENAIILIVGKGHNFDDLYSRHNHEIIFTNKISHKDAINLLSIMDICVIPYAKDEVSTPAQDYYSARKTMEYILLNKPIIVSDVVAKESFLQNNKNALFYEPGNAEDLAMKIRLLLSDENLVASMKEYNLTLINNISWEYFVKKSLLIDIIINDC